MADMDEKFDVNNKKTEDDPLDDTELKLRDEMLAELGEDAKL